MRFGYRLMRGRQGVSGHVRAMGNSAILSVRGLMPGEPCALYALEESGVKMLETRTVDRDGRAQFLAQIEEPLFVAQNGRVVRWEDGPDAEEQYLLASAWVRKENEKTIEPEQEVTEAGKNTLEENAEAAHPAVTGGDVSDLQTQENHPEQKDGPKRFALRPAGTGEPVDALPILRWPAETEDLRLNCTLRQPFAPFDAPGWRFVQVPSPLPRVPFCAVGYRAQDARVRDIAYVIPGLSDHPPVRLAGYHYCPGRRGQGYWVTTKRV